MLRDPSHLKKKRKLKKDQIFTFIKKWNKRQSSNTTPKTLQIKNYKIRTIIIIENNITCRAPACTDWGGARSSDGCRCPLLMTVAELQCGNKDMINEIILMPCAVLSGLQQPDLVAALQITPTSDREEITTDKSMPAESIALSEVGIKSPEQRHNYTSIKQ